MSFIRPEVRAAAWRWREALTGVAIALFGLWWVSKTAALMTWIGLGVVLLGLAMVLTGIQRGRFRSAGDGPGLVRVTEAQIAYMGPRTGGFIGLPDLVRFWPDERRYELVEVKAPGDQLQDNQIRWLAYCRQHGLPVRVCHVQWRKDGAA